MSRIGITVILTHVALELHSLRITPPLRHNRLPKIRLLVRILLSSPRE